MPGLIEEGYRLRGDAIQGYGDVGAMKIDRDKLNYELKAQHDAQQGQMYGTIAGALAAGALSGLGAKASDTTPVIDKGNNSVQGIPTTPGGKGGTSLFAPNAISNAPVTQGALPQSPAQGTANTGIFPQGAIRNAPMAQGALPQSASPTSAASYSIAPTAPAASGGWWDNLTHW